MDRIKDLISRFKNSRFGKLILNGIKLFGENDMSVFAGYSTLFIVTSFFPFVVLIIAIVNLLPGYSAKDVGDIMFQILPDMGAIKGLISSMITDVKDQSGGLLASAAALTTLWSASKGVSAIQKGLDQLDSDEMDETANIEEPGLKEKAKSAALRILKRLLFTLMLIILIPALLVFEMLGDSVARFICNALDKLHLEGLNDMTSDINSFFFISSLVVILFALLVILAIFAILPEKRRTLKSQLPGAILTGVCWLLFTKLFSIFIPKFFNASLYGSLASLFLMLLWLWCVVMILFAGGILNHALEDERQEIEESSESD